MRNSNQWPAARGTSRALSMIYLARTSSLGVKSIGRRLASVSLPVVAGIALAMLIVWWIERIPIQVPPVDGGWR